MCQRCLDNCYKHLPDIREDWYFDFLMEYTCFPFGSAKMVEDQIITIAYHEYFKDWL